MFFSVACRVRRELEDVAVVDGRQPQQPGRGGCGDEPCPEAKGGEKLGVLYHREPGVNFTNIVLEAFAHRDPKSEKRTDDLTVIFALLGSAHVKASLKLLVKSTLDGRVEDTASKSQGIG